VRVGFFAQGEGEHLHIAKHLIKSCQKVMPDVEVFQLTDDKTPALAEAIRIGGDIPMAVRRITHHSTLEGDWLFVDTDCVIRKDVRSVFDDPFEIAVTDRKGSIWEKSPYGMVMPYNMGVTFSRSPGFWKIVLENLLTLPEKYQQWEGDQRVVCEMIRAGFPVKVLPGKVYNYTPEVRGDKAEHAAILHLKGPRKHWIEDYANNR
jgi:hypothetical protein